LTDVKPIENVVLKNTFQGIVGTCEYVEEGFWQGCNENIGDDAIFGSFSQPGVSEVYLSTTRACGGCFFGNLFRQENDEWSLVSDDIGYYGSACLKFTTSYERDLLVCYANGKEEDDTSVEIWVLDFSNKDLRRTLLLFFNPWAYDGNFCTAILQGGKSIVTYHKPINWIQTDFDSDGDADLYFTLNTFQITRDNCVNRTVDYSTLLAIKNDLVWLFDGETFTPTSETQAFLHNLPKQ
jgi:hypothetical protein